MAYVSAVEGGYGLGASVIANDSSQHAVIVPDADLLFNGAFRRAGPDLILTGQDGRHHTIPGYFSSEHPPALVAPNGASLAADTVGLLAGSPAPGQYAQTQPITPPDAIGHVEKVVGDCTVIRNGASVTLNVGDAVYKSDVIQTGAGASAGISFPDGTALNLVANTRMALNEYSYDPNGNSNAALMTLVEGTFAFVAGKVAHTGDMKIVTPVATMGIRGTTGVVEEQPQQPGTVTSNQGQLAYSFAVVQDFGTNANGAYTLCYTDPNTGACQVFTTIAQTGYLTMVTPQGIGQAPNISVEPLSISQLQFEQQITHELFELLSPSPPTPNSSNGSSTPQPFIQPNPNPQQYDNNGMPLYVFAPPLGGPISSGPPVIQPGAGGPTAVVVWLGGSGNWDTATGWSDGYVASSISLVEIFAPVTVTVSDGESAGGLHVGIGATVDIVNGGALTIFDEITGAGTVELNATGSDPSLIIDGTVTLKGGGTILMTGTPGDDDIVGFHGSGAKLVNVDYTITGGGTIGHDGDGNLTFVNEGTVDATGLLTIHTGNEVANTATGLMEATAGGTLQIEDDVGNCGIVEATGAGATVSLLNSSFDNMGSLIATNDGAVTLSSVFLTNETGGIFKASDGGSITYDTGNLTNDGSVLADGGSITFEGSLEINNNAGATFEATAGGSITLDGADGLSLTNLATIEADNGGTITFDQVAVTNYGAIIEAEAGGTIVIETDSGPGVFGGTIQADGAGSTVQLESASLNDLTLESSGGGEIEAVSGTSTLLNDTFDGTTLNVETGATVDLSGGTSGIAAVIDGTVTFEGAGTVTLDFASYKIVAGGAGAVLDDDTTISGSGQIGTGDNSLTLNIGSAGAIETSGTFVIDTGANVVGNAGLLEALSGGTLTIDSGVNNTGTVKADGGTVTFNGSAAVLNATGGTMTADGGTLVFDTTGGVTNQAGATIEALDGGVLQFETAITLDNAGTIELTDGTLALGGNMTLDGGGNVTLSDDTDNAVMLNDGSGNAIESDGSAVTLTNVDNTIAGAGTIGDANLTLINETHGTIDADDAAPLILDTGDNLITNLGLLEATAGGTLEIESEVANTGGTISASGAGSVVDLIGVVITDGTLETSAGGVIETLSGTSTLIGVTIDGGSTLEAGDSASIDLQGTTTLQGGTVTLEGGGTFVLSDDGAAIVGSGSGAALDNEGTLTGAGTIGNGGTTTLALTNDGTIDADVMCQALTIDTGSTVANNSLLEATNGATLKIDDSVDNACGATIKADGATVDLNGGYTNHGTIETADCGVINIAVDDGDGVNCGMIEAVHGTINITVTGYAYNYGTEEAGAGGTLNIIRLDTVVMQGAGNLGLVEAIDGGTINYSGSGGSYGTIEASGCDSTVTFNLADATQTNNGGTMEALRNGAMTFNGGTINNNAYDETAATVKAASGGTVTVNGSTVNNTGGSIFEALSCGIITFDCGATINNHSGAMIEALRDGTVNIDCSTVNNSGGTIEASGACSTVDLAGATIKNGTLETSCGGLIQTVCGSGNSTFENLTIATGSAVLVNDGTSLTLEGTIDNKGTITLAAATDPSLVIDGTVTLSGDGAIVLNGCGDCIVGADGDGPSTLDSSNTISGAGMIGGGNLVLVNEACGTVDADVCGATLTINTGDNQISNLGTLEATSGGILAIDSSLDNSNLVLAQGHGSTITISADVTNESSAQIEAESCGTITFDCLCFTNDCSASIDATTGGVITFDHSHLDNYGQVSADCGGSVVFCHSTVDNNGALIDGNFNGIQTGDGGTITFDCSNVVNTGYIGAAGGTITFDDSCVNNSGGAIGGNGIVAFDGGSVTFEHSQIDNTGTIGAFTSTDGGPAGTIYIDDSTVHNVCGTISAIGCGDTVQLSDATICGGTLATSDNGLIEVVASDDGTTLFDGSDHTVTVAGAVQVEACADLGLAGTIDFDNGGTITLLSGSDSGANLVINGTVTLDSEGDGSGGVVLDGCGTAIVGDDSDGGSTLHNDATISGAGTIGGGNLTLVNEACGTVTADVCGQTLDINTGHDISNAGVLEATNGGTLQIDDSVCNSGLLSVNCGGTLDVTASSITWTGDTATAGTNGIVLDHGTLLVDSASLTLDGGGAVSLDCGTITAAACDNTLYNADTITGTGSIGGGGLVLNNEGCGVIDANVSCGTLTLDTGSNTITNLGTLQAENGGTLDVKSMVDNCGGTLVANSGGLLNVESCITGGSAMITGGTLEFGASSNVNVTFCNGSADSPTYGTLVLGDAKDFSGQIYGFTGTCGDAAHSDTVELAGICETSWCAVQSGDNEILTINYGDGQHVTLTFDDFDACFTIVTKDGNTYIYDPPASGSSGNGAAPGPAHAGGPVGVTGAIAGAGPVGPTGAFVSASTTANGAPVGTTSAFIAAGTSTNGAPVGTTGAFVGATSHAETATLSTIAGLLSEFVGTLGVPLGTVGTLAATSLPLAADPFGTASAFVGSSPAASGWTHTTGTPATPTVSAFVSAGGDDVTAQTGSVHTTPQNDSAPTPTVSAFVAGAVPTPPVGALGPAHHDGGPVGAIGSLTSTGVGNDVTGHTSAWASTAPQNEATPTPTVSAFVAAVVPTPPVGALGPAHHDGGPVGAIGALTSTGVGNDVTGHTSALAGTAPQNEATPTPTVSAFVAAVVPTPPVGALGPAHHDSGPVGAIGSIGGETAGATVDATPHTTSVTTGIGLNFGTDQFVPASSPPVQATAGGEGWTNHVGAVSVALGGAGHDAFVFNSVAGPDGFVGVHAPGGSTEVDHVSNVQPVVPQLVALLTEVHDAVSVEAVHTDVVNTAMDQFHQMVASVGHLH